jgi:hypothetical protein
LEKKEILFQEKIFSERLNKEVEREYNYRILLYSLQLRTYKVKKKEECFPKQKGLKIMEALIKNEKEKKTTPSKHIWNRH